MENVNARSTSEDLLHRVLLEKSLATQYTCIIESTKKRLSRKPFASHQNFHASKESNCAVSKSLIAFCVQQILTIARVVASQNHVLSAGKWDLDRICAFVKVLPLKDHLSKILIAMNFMILRKKYGQLKTFPAAFSRFDLCNKNLSRSLKPAQGMSTFVQTYSSSLHKLLNK